MVTVLIDPKLEVCKINKIMTSDVLVIYIASSEK